jgi:hypothetical protein
MVTASWPVVPECGLMREFMERLAPRLDFAMFCKACKARHVAQPGTRIDRRTAAGNERYIRPGADGELRFTANATCCRAD